MTDRNFRIGLAVFIAVLLVVVAINARANLPVLAYKGLVIGLSVAIADAIDSFWFPLQKDANATARAIVYGATVIAAALAL